jgi:hypothetical protein
MKKYQLATVSSPCIEFEVGGHIIESTVITNTAKNPNFDDPLFFFDIVSYKRFCTSVLAKYPKQHNP